MSDHTAIEWADASWNPLRGVAPSRHVCQKISPGCDQWENYAERVVSHAKSYGVPLDEAGRIAGVVLHGS